MNRHLTAKLLAALVLLAGGALLGGCDLVGDEASENEGPTRDATADRQGENEALDRDDQGDEGHSYADRPGAPDPGGVPGKALDACRDIAEDAPALSDAARDRIVRECEGAATGDEETVRRAAEAACDAAATAAVPAIARGPVADACKSTLP